MEVTILFKFRIIPLLLLLFSIFTIGLSSKYNAATELIYTNVINRGIREKISLLVGKTNLSVGEILLVIIFILIIVFLINFVRRILKPSKWLESLVRFFWGSVNIISILLFIYILMFGLNYHTPSLDKNLVEKYNNKYSTEIKVSIDNQKREEVFKYLVEKTKESRDILKTTEGLTSYNFLDLSEQAVQGYNIISEAFPNLGGKYSLPKKSFANEGMMFLGLDARYSMFANEITVNTKIPNEYMPFVISKYMAYQRGIAREDEASFFAYLACTNNSDIKFKYSGYLVMLSMVSESMRNYNRVAYNNLVTSIDENVVRDLAKIESYKENYGHGTEFKDLIKNNFKRLNGDIRIDGVENQVTQLLSIYYSLFTYN